MGGRGRNLGVGADFRTRRRHGIDGYFERYFKVLILFEPVTGG